MAWTQLIQSARAALGKTPSCSTPGLSRFYSKPATYFDKCDLEDMVSNPNLVLGLSLVQYGIAVKVGIPEFLGGIGRGAETHIAKIETEIGDLHKLLVTRTLRLKKLGIPCKHRKLILKYGQKYRLGLWKPRADAIKA
ncbi:IGR protein motif [Arabidopsis thaliana x Arabidopsis arenosa]|uniref:IGR protein motif n=1 Tax=Arabidopsis thaliana x Arabidopsis arenosa TaxID=1240361 RepID=A0A8T2AQ95_9BRAS|nr:IGR protein motif [Arabidopsis thaliana x Arabidopsis arenosa]